MIRMAKVVAVVLLGALLSCKSKKPEPETKIPEVDNAATRYAEDLRDQVQNAQEAKDLANEVTDKHQAAYDEIFK